MDDISQLADLVLPSPVTWWPLAIGWYLMLGLLVIAVAIFGLMKWRRWQNNRYRREALAKLAVLTPDNAYLFPRLLRQVSAIAFKGLPVLNSTGRDWHQFLNGAIKNPVFSDTDFQLMDKLSYQDPALYQLSQQQFQSLQHSCQLWIREHQSDH